MPKCYQLVGVPASGKSTWVANQSWTKDCAYISTDHYVEEFAKARGKTYNQVFRAVMPDCVRHMTADVVNARVADQDVIWDQTSTTVGSRARKFRMLPNYEHIAVVFAVPESAELARRLISRLGKNIPDHVMSSMIKGFEQPTEAEGFMEIWNAA